MIGLRTLCWQGCEEPEITGPFADRHGIRIETRTLVSAADASARLQRVEAKHWDVLNINNAHTRRISRELAEDHNFELANQPESRGRFGTAYPKSPPKDSPSEPANANAKILLKWCAIPAGFG